MCWLLSWIIQSKFDDGHTERASSINWAFNRTISFSDCPSKWTALIINAIFFQIYWKYWFCFLLLNIIKSVIKSSSISSLTQNLVEISRIVVYCPTFSNFCWNNFSQSWCGISELKKMWVLKKSFWELWYFETVICFLQEFVQFFSL